MNAGRTVWRAVLKAAYHLAGPALRVRGALSAPPGGSPVHVIGDSHVSLFSGADEMVPAWPRRSADRLDRYRTYRLGSVLAYRLADADTTSGGRERLFTLLAFGPIAPGATVMLCFGEIDCRLHLPRLVERSGRSVEDVVGECVERYAGVVREVSRLGFRVLVWGVVPSLEQEPGETCEEYPYWGTAVQRNRVTESFNVLLARELQPDGIPVITVWDDLVSDYSAEDSRGHYMDRVHLGVSSLELADREIRAALE